MDGGRGRGGGAAGWQPRQRRGSRPPHDRRPPQQGASPHQSEFEDARNRRGVRFLKWNEITGLAGTTSDMVVEAILQNEAGFLSVFSHSGSCSNPRILKALIKIVYLLVKSKEDNLASRVLGQIYSPDGNCAQFCFQVDRLIKGMPIEQKHNMTEILNYLQYLMDIGLFGVQKIPHTILGSFPQATIAGTIRALSQNGIDVRLLERKCAELEHQLDLAREQLQSQPTPTEKSVLEEDDKAPPEHFNDIPILPQNEDLVSGRRPFLRSNKVKGLYKGWDHYLDVQFRLLREDFIAPLREGINEGTPEYRRSAICTYERVHVLAPVCLVSGMGFEISFDTSRFQRTNWEHSRRLIFGSLLCLSNQDFREGSIIFATVVKRDAKQLDEGRLIVKFEGNTSGFHIDPNDKYTMVESTAYFEAYRHVLLALQNASLLKDTMPFKRYIVDCKLHDPNPPLYIRRYNATRFNLLNILGCKGADNIKITDERTWPHYKSTVLDKSQYEALKMAMRQEISCIQGPPGTGKTFIGVKLVQVFMHNRLGWDPEKNSPILLVCYTNHALDQFLEEIIDAYSEDKLPPPEIVRIGGRCKSENLANFVLAQKVTEVRNSRTLPVRMYRGSRELRNEMSYQMKTFTELQKQMGSIEHGVLSLSTLKLVISNEHYFQLSQGMPTEAGKEIEVWLNLWKPTEPTEFDEVEEYEQTGILQQFAIDEGPAEHGERNSGDEMVAVDEEATILQEERIIEGEEVLFNDGQVIPKSNPENPKPKKEQGTNEWQTVQISDKERAKRIKKGLKLRPLEKNDAMRVEDLRFLDESQRWRMYHYWVQEYLRVVKRQLEGPAEAYNRTCSDYSQMKQEIDCYVARGADIIGMTTTGAAKHHHILKNIHPKIVVIEEAAEVFESHVITSLSPSVQQLILIGDHKQLRPKPNHYELEKKYNLDVSLFQRLIENGIPHVTLTVQHRMRPDIASLIHPTIYPELHNGPRAIEHGRHKIAGVGPNLFFLHHEHPENQQNLHESLSHVNVHEADFMVALCRYLMKQGYRPTQITLLTMYRGQLLQMKTRMRRSEFGGVRVAAVDDFQGEENDIILLSLVRSNSDGKIGFLKIENRVCVALSRARKGLYVIGNFEILRSREDTIWPRIISVVEEKKCIGEALLLQCQNHPQEVVRAKVASDFSKCPEGGCTKPCNYRLECGHGCTRLCHPWDREHKLFKCQKRCDKPLPCQHLCKRKCYECIDGCGPCEEVEERRVTKCGHKMKMKCHENPTMFPCSAQCQKPLRCGHFCQRSCSEPCNTRCSLKVQKVLPCGHNATVPCHKSIETVICSVPCNTLLQCEHECKGTCGRCQQGRLHIHCKSECGRTLVCRHICNFPCSAECPPCMQKCSNFCLHSKCPKRCYEPCDPCAEPCKWNCEHLRCTKKCGELCNRPRCNEPCRKQLYKCGHPCIGLCGDKCPKLCRECDKDKVTEVLFGTEDEPDARFVQLQDCKHVFEYTGLDQWIGSEESEEIEIQFKKCPRCTTPIRTSLRYYNEVKKVHNHFEEIKKKQLQMSNISQDLMPKLWELQSKGGKCDEVTADLKKIESLLNTSTQPRFILPHCLSALQNQLNMLPNLVKMYNELTQISQKSWQLLDCKINVEAVHQQLECVQGFLMQDTLTDQQLSDIQYEVRRLNCMIRLLKLHSLITERKITITPQEKEGFDRHTRYVYHSGTCRYGTPKVSEQYVDGVSQLITGFEQKYKLEGLTQAERIEIVKAVGLSKGHWFRCPNGHYYCIGECGGATEVGKCPECHADIGGTGHTLLAGNALAPEMDGAAHPAWSDQANMANYNFDNLQ